MKYGAGAVNSLLIDDPTAMRDLAQAAEELGYDFLTLIDHVVLAYPASDGTARSHYPARTPYHDILVSLGYLAGVTARIALRTAVVILPQRGPAVVAKQAAAADASSVSAPAHRPVAVRTRTSATATVLVIVTIFIRNSVCVDMREYCATACRSLATLTPATRTASPSQVPQSARRVTPPGSAGLTPRAPTAF